MTGIKTCSDRQDPAARNSQRFFRQKEVKRIRSTTSAEEEANACTEDEQRREKEALAWTTKITRGRANKNYIERAILSLIRTYREEVRVGEEKTSLHQTVRD